MKQGYLPVFDFISHVKKKNKHKAPPKLLATEATKRGAIVFDEEEEENGGNGPEGKSTSNPMCDSVVQVRLIETLFQI